MGYQTEFSGAVKFTSPLTAEQELYIGQFLDYADPDKHDDWIKPDKKYSYIQWELTPDKSGIKWDGNEKFYYSVEAMNLIIANMVDKFPDFGVKGKILAQGEGVGDIWWLKIINNIAHEVKIDIDD